MVEKKIDRKPVGGEIRRIQMMTDPARGEPYEHCEPHISSTIFIVCFNAAVPLIDTAVIINAAVYSEGGCNPWQ